MQVQYRRKQSILIKLQVGTYNLPGYIGIFYVGTCNLAGQISASYDDYETVVDRTYNMFVLMFELVQYNK